MKLITLLFLILISSYVKANSCRAFLDTELNIVYDSHLSVTDNFIAYLSVLFEGRLIPDQYLLTLLNDLEKQKSISNPFIGLNIDSNQKIHQENFQSYLNSQDLDRNKIKDWALRTLKTKQQIDKSKDESKTNTIRSYIPMEFHRIEPTQVEMLTTLITMDHMFSLPDTDENHKKTHLNLYVKRKLSIPKPIEVMKTLVTQAMWVEVMESNPSVWNSGDYSHEINIKNQNIKLQVDNPVEGISWWDAILFANKLSEKQGLIPVYDVSRITNLDDILKLRGSTPIREAITNARKLLRINNNNGKRNGYRLPTYAELMLLNTNMGQVVGVYDGYFPGIDNISDYIRWHHNSGPEKYAGSRPIMTRKPFMVGDKDFYDLRGNVRTWTHDWMPKSNDKEIEDLDTEYPYVDVSDLVIIIPGFMQDRSDSFKALATSAFPSQRANGLTGLRLVRSLE